MNNKLAMASLGIAGCLAGGALADDTFRCRTHLIKVGDTKLDVMKRCGAPVFQETISGVDEGLVEQWHYWPGTQSFQRILTFTGCCLIAIDTVAKP